jgi:hypothetical protein
VKQWIAQWAGKNLFSFYFVFISVLVGIGKERVKYILRKEPVPWSLEWQYSVADRILFSKIRDQFLGGRLR